MEKLRPSKQVPVQGPAGTRTQGTWSEAFYCRLRPEKWFQLTIGTVGLGGGSSEQPTLEEEGQEAPQAVTEPPLGLWHYSGTLADCISIKEKSL